MKTQITIDMRRVLQIVLLYAFALFAAVACGDAFPVRKNESMPQITFASKTVSMTEYGAYAELKLNLTSDGAVSQQSLQLYSGMGTPRLSGQTTQALGKDSYGISAACENEMCSTAVVVITRKSTPEQIVYFLTSSSTEVMTVRSSLKSTSNYVSADQVYSDQVAMIALRR